MSDERSLTAWQQCKEIAQALSPAEQAAQKLREHLLAGLAAGSPEGARLADRLASTDGPIEVTEEELPPELLGLAAEAKRMAGL